MCPACRNYMHTSEHIDSCATLATLRPKAVMPGEFSTLPKRVTEGGPVHLAGSPSF